MTGRNHELPVFSEGILKDCITFKIYSFCVYCYTVPL